MAYRSKAKPQTANTQQQALAKLLGIQPNELLPAVGGGWIATLEVGKAVLRVSLIQRPDGQSYRLAIKPEASTEADLALAGMPLHSRKQREPQPNKPQARKPNTKPYCWPSDEAVAKMLQEAEPMPRKPRQPKLAKPSTGEPMPRLRVVG